MKKVTKLAVVDHEKCTGCKICYFICPVLAIKMESRKAVIIEDQCLGCSNCEQRCPQYAVEMVPREEPLAVGLDLSRFDYAVVMDMCAKAKFHPEQVICFCTGTRAGEIAAAILDGARTPEEVALKTGARTGCKVLCIEPVLRQLYAAGIEPPKPDGFQWCGVTATLWDLSEEVKAKYTSRGFYFDADRDFLDGNLAYELKKGGK
ncbi:MAG: 4Fe-4S dicluster-binding protein [Desulfocucumaceae bacterium]